MPERRVLMASSRSAFSLVRLSCSSWTSLGVLFGPQVHRPQRVALAFEAVDVSLQIVGVCIWSGVCVEGGEQLVGRKWLSSAMRSAAAATVSRAASARASARARLRGPQKRRVRPRAQQGWLHGRSPRPWRACRRHEPCATPLGQLQCQAFHVRPRSGPGRLVPPPAQPPRSACARSAPLCASRPFPTVAPAAHFFLDFLTALTRASPSRRSSSWAERRDIMVMRAASTVMRRSSARCGRRRDRQARPVRVRLRLRGCARPWLRLRDV